MNSNPFSLFQTIRGKMTILYVLVFGFIVAICSVILYTAYAQRLRGDLDESLVMIALSLTELVHQDGIVSKEIFHELSEAYLSFDHGSRLYVEILKRDGSVILKYPQPNEVSLPLRPEIISRAFLGKSTFVFTKLKLSSSPDNQITARLLLRPDMATSAAKYVFAIAIPTARMEQILVGLRLIMLVLFPLVMLLTSFAGWFLAGRTFRPVNQLISDAQKITAEQLSKRLTVGPVDDEISRLSATLNEMINRIEQSFLDQKQFTADVSHELRTPLTILSGEIEVALQHSRTKEEYHRILRSNLEEIQRLQKILNDLLLLCQIDSGKIMIDQRPIRLDELLIAAIQKVSQAAKSREISINLRLDEGVDQGLSESMIMANSACLLNVFINLLDNAIRFSSIGSKISCVLKEGYDHVEVTIQDNGEGISEEHLERVFDRFYRVDRAVGNTSKSGIGLGLAISRSVVEVHGGKISLNSSPGQGTTVRVLLPLTNKGS
jgi:heavy metal sensor kinase